MNDYMTISQVSEKTHWSIGTIYNRLSSGKDMPPTVQIGRRRLFPAKEFEEWMQSQIIQNNEITILGFKTGIQK